MARLEIDPDRTQFTVGTRPGLPGLGARITGVRGWVDAALAADGTLDLAAPITGELLADADRIETGNQLVAAAMARWLAARSTMPIRVVLTEVRPGAGDRFDVVLHAAGAEREADLIGSGRWRTIDGGAIEAAGVTLCDPRAFGISLPPLLNLIVHVRWRVTLVPPV